MKLAVKESLFKLQQKHPGNWPTAFFFLDSPLVLWYCKYQICLSLIQ